MLTLNRWSNLKLRAYEFILSHKEKTFSSRELGVYLKMKKLGLGGLTSSLARNSVDGVPFIESVGVDKQRSMVYVISPQIPLEKRKKLLEEIEKEILRRKALIEI